MLPIPQLLSSPETNLRIIPNSLRFPRANSIPRNIIQLSCLGLQPAPPSRRLPSRNGKRGGNTRRDGSAGTTRGWKWEAEMAGTNGQGRHGLEMVIEWGKKWEVWSYKCCMGLWVLSAKSNTQSPGMNVPREKRGSWWKLCLIYYFINVKRHFKKYIYIINNTRGHA